MHERMLTGALFPALLLTVVAILIATLWWALGRPVAMPVAGEA